MLQLDIKIVHDGVIYYILKCYVPVDRVSRYIHLKENQTDTQFTFSIFRQTPVHVSDLSIAHRDIHNLPSVYFVKNLYMFRAYL